LGEAEVEMENGKGFYLLLLIQKLMETITLKINERNKYGKAILELIRLSVA
jgi:hypothetical protein